MAEIREEFEKEGVVNDTTNNTDKRNNQPEDGKKIYTGDQAETHHTLAADADVEYSGDYDEVDTDELVVEGNVVPGTDLVEKYRADQEKANARSHFEDPKQVGSGEFKKMRGTWANGI